MTFERNQFDELIEKFGKVEKTIKRKNASQKQGKIQAREKLIIKLYNKIVTQAEACENSNYCE